MDENMIMANFGNVKISDEVVATIASVATLEVPGVAGMASRFTSDIKGMINKKGMTKGIKVEILPEGVTVDVYVILTYGKKLQEVAVNVQNNVRKSIEMMSGLPVSKVNVHVLGVNMEKPAQEPKEQE